ncbi:hypothetical protein GCM10027577_36710 [Spirosoma fluminis]
MVKLFGVTLGIHPGMYGNRALLIETDMMIDSFYLPPITANVSRTSFTMPSDRCGYVKQLSKRVLDIFVISNP